MNNDNALMLEALAKSRSPKQVLREGDEYEDDYNSPGIRAFRNTDNLYTVMFFREPGNPKGIITYHDPYRRSVNKAAYWAKHEGILSSDIISGERNNNGTWWFVWNWGHGYHGSAEGFIEGEDFEFVKK